MYYIYCSLPGLHGGHQEPELFQEDMGQDRSPRILQSEAGAAQPGVGIGGLNTVLGSHSNIISYVIYMFAIYNHVKAGYGSWTSLSLWKSLSRKNSRRAAIFLVYSGGIFSSL